MKTGWVLPPRMTCNMTLDEVERTDAFGTLTPQVVEWHKNTIKSAKKQLLAAVQNEINQTMKEYTNE